MQLMGFHVYILFHGEGSKRDALPMVCAMLKLTMGVPTVVCLFSLANFKLEVHAQNCHTERTFLSKPIFGSIGSASRRFVLPRTTASRQVHGRWWEGSFLNVRHDALANDQNLWQERVTL